MTIVALPWRPHSPADFEKDPPVCESCGDECDRLYEVDDSDPSVGYRRTLEVCAPCLERRRR